MKLVFISNYYNHHQHALCQALYALNPGDFYFIATSEMRAERRALGYGGLEIPHYVRTAHTGKADLEASRRLIDEADAVIVGSVPENMIASRIRAGKLTIRYTERILRGEHSAAQLLRKMLAQHLRNPWWSRVYLLGAGAYTAADYARLGLFRDRAYRWGYFPHSIRYPSPEGLLAGKEKTRILWVARLIELKHPEQALEVAGRLKEDGRSFTLDLIGIGPMEAQLRQWIRQWNLEDSVHLLGAMKPEEVRTHMEQAGIFLFTSDKQEGWGAVLNESMNSGCAVVASHAIGSVPFLLEDGKNGCVYRSGDVDGLYEKVTYLLDHPQEQTRLGKAAYETITGCWNAETAAARLCQLAERILAGEESPELFESGPCSRADIMYDDWM